MKQITVLFNGKRQATFLLDEAHVVIGRGRTAHIALDGNPIVSRQHAVIREEGGFHVIEDLGGANGTFVNDAVVRTTRLHLRDRITLGKHTLRYEDGTAEAISLRRREQRAPGPQDMVATGAMPAVSELQPAPALHRQIGPTKTSSPAAPAPPWQRSRRAPAAPLTGGAQSGMGGHEHTMAASKEELEHLLQQMKIKAGAHLSVPTEGGLQLLPLENPPVRIGYTEDCLVRLPGSKWFGKIACSLEHRKGEWWLHARAPFWSPVSVGTSKVTKKRKLTDGAVIQAGPLKLRFSLGEQS